MSGYRVRDGEWTLIGRQSPQLPQVRFSWVWVQTSGWSCRLWASWCRRPRGPRAEALASHLSNLGLVFGQAFYPATKGLSLKYGDTVAARCMFTGENMTTTTYIG